MSEDIEGRGIKNAKVLDALSRVPREKFVPEDLAESAYGDFPLPIGFGQTISQPYIVAYMTEQLLVSGKLDKVLEIGTGSGYQAAVLSLIAQEVYSVEILKPLYESATERFKILGYKNIWTHLGDGAEGWPEHAPYDGIIVTAASQILPEKLIEQLSLNGRMIIPIGPPVGLQHLMLISKDAQGKLHTQELLPVAFVPMVSKR